jgi:predicted nucleic acid-binding protein
MNFVFDCSIAMAWCFEDKGTELTDSLLERLAQGSAKVPSIWSVEVANVLVISERKGRTTQAKITQFLGLLSKFPSRRRSQNWRQGIH